VAGKTAVLDVAVYALAKGAPGAARRIFFVVDRRVVVDEAAARAEHLKEALEKAAPESELGKVAQRLREIGRSTAPLVTATLRCGIPKENWWTDSPIQPAIVCSTVDQIGSSLLFQAYGVSPYPRQQKPARWYAEPGTRWKVTIVARDTISWSSDIVLDQAVMSL
jgi:CRISPR-associated endonuclease/helicase Cas3